MRSMAVIALAAIVVTGCGGIDGVDLQGGVFDALGVSSSSSQRKLADAKVDARPGLVLPPSADRLPPPGEGKAEAVPQDPQWPTDPQDRRAQARGDLERRHKEYCERALQNARVMGQQSGVIMGPMGNCQPGLFGSFTQNVTGTK